MRTPVYRLMSDGQNDLLRSLLIPLAAPLGVSWEFRQGEGSDGLAYLWAVVDDRHLDPIIGVVRSLTDRSLLP